MAALAETTAGATAAAADTATAKNAAIGASNAQTTATGGANKVLETLKSTPRKNWWKPILALSNVVPTKEDGEDVLCDFDTSEYEKLLVFKKIIDEETDLAQYRVHARVRAEIDIFSGMLIDTACTFCHRARSGARAGRKLTIPPRALAHVPPPLRPQNLG